jgi:hypothetical protein
VVNFRGRSNRAMNIESIVNELKAERDRLDRAIAALDGVGWKRQSASATRDIRRRRPMSASARRRISATMKARWATRKKSAGKTA